MIRTQLCRLFILACFYLCYVFADQLLLASDRVNTCDEIKDATPFAVDEQNNLYVVNESNKSQNLFIHIYLRNPDGCRVVLSTQGSGVDFIKNSKNKFPDIQASWHMGADKSVGTLYIWNGNRYISSEVKDSERLNQEALEYFKKGNIEQAITIWKKAKDFAIIPGLGFTSNAEVLNNLGFAYYKMGRDYYPEAIEYLKSALEVDPNRLTIYLNLGDIYKAMVQRALAVDNYKKVLELKPDYKYAARLKREITAYNMSVLDVLTHK